MQGMQADFQQGYEERQSTNLLDQEFLTRNIEWRQ
jgi:hypothetical protein